MSEEMASIPVCRELLDVCNLSVEFPVNNGAVLRALDGVCLKVAAGEVHGLVGESGSGKTVLALSILRLIDDSVRNVQGKILWLGKDLLTLTERDINEVRGRAIAMVFQNAPASLNPALKVETQIVSLLKFRRGMNRSDAKNEASRLLDAVHLRDSSRILSSYPHELSVGMAQRVAIALALACQPRLLIADEPTSALDATTAVQLLDLLRELRDKFGLGILLISHDLGVIARLCDCVSVINSGKIVEQGTTPDVFHHPQHPYTKTLLQSVLIPDPSRRVISSQSSAHPFPPASP